MTHSLVAEYATAWNFMLSNSGRQVYIPNHENWGDSKNSLQLVESKRSGLLQKNERKSNAHLLSQEPRQNSSAPDQER